MAAQCLRAFAGDEAPHVERFTGALVLAEVAQAVIRAADDLARIAGSLGAKNG